MSGDLYLGKVLNNVETKVTKTLPNFKIPYEDLGEKILILGDSIETTGWLTKLFIEELLKNDELVFAFDSNGILSSFNLIFPRLEPEDFAKWILLDSSEDYLDLEAIETSSRFNEKLEIFNISKDELLEFKTNLFSPIFTPNSDNGLNISSGIFNIDFSRLKTFAKPIIFSLVAWLLNDDSISKYEEEINFLKIVFEFIKKYQIIINTYPKAKSFLNELKENLDKFPGSSQIKDKITQLLINFTQSNAQLLFEGVNLDLKKILKFSINKYPLMILFLKHIEDVFFKNFLIMRTFHLLYDFLLDFKDKKVTIILDNIDTILFFKEFQKSLSSLESTQLNTPRIIYSLSSFKNMFLLDLSEFKEIFISNTTNDNLKNTLGRRFGLPVEQFSSLKEDQFITFFDSEKKLISLRPTYSYHRVLEPFEIAKLTTNDLRNEFSSFYQRLDNIKEEYPELKKKKIGILTIENGPLRGKDIIIDKDEIVVGRYEIYPQNKLISRKHFKIQRDGDDFIIIDTSVNGVFINGRRITKATLKDRDVIVLGRNETSLYFEIKEI
ncbi:MAG: FHA domain-containing protein [Promethearchaeota archaeon]